MRNCFMSVAFPNQCNGRYSNLFCSSLLIFYSLVLFACGDKKEAIAPTGKGKETTQTSKERTGLVKAPVTQAETSDGKFEIELKEVSLVDVGLQSISKSSVMKLAEIDGDDPGPRLLVRGSIKNRTEDWIIEASVRATQELCRKDCDERASHGHGFKLKVNGEEPWKPNTWRHFEVVTRASNPISRHRPPKSVKGSIELKTRVLDSNEFTRIHMWDSDIEWVSLGGYPIREAFLINESRRLPKIGSLKAGSSLSISAVAGNALYVETNTKSAWVPIVDLPEARPLLTKRAPAVSMPASRTSEKSIVTVHSMTTLIQDQQTEGKPSKRLLLFDVEVAAVGSERSSLYLRKNNFRLIVGSQEREAVAKYKSVYPFRFGTVRAGEPVRGTIAFECPIGTNPINLKVSIRGDESWVVALPVPKKR